MVQSEEASMVVNHVRQSILEEGLEAFRKDLPELLTLHYLRWALYHGVQRIALADSQADLFEEIERRGLDPGDCLVECVVEEPEPMAVESFLGK
jgi:hypothetical protein